MGKDSKERMKAEFELNEYRNRLEMLVEERTAELRSANQRLRQEILERKKAENELRSKEKLLRTVLETLPIGVWILDEKGRIIHGNPAGRHIWAGGGCADLDTCGEYKAWRLDTGEIIKPEEWAGAKAIMRGETTLNEEIEVECFNGERKIILNSAVPIRKSGGELTGVVVINQDISNRKAIERRLYQSQRMEAVGDLAAGIAHDFNNILGVIFGFAQLALREAAEGSQLKNCLEDIFKASNRAKDLVTQILAFSRNGEQKHSPVEIGKLINEVAKFLKASLPSSIEILTEIETDEGSDTVLADPSHLHQLLMNLCTNAAHAMREQGGVLKISLSSVEITAETALRHPGLSVGSHLELSVSDTGCGIDPAIIDRVFEPYFTTRQAGEGSGLGLAVAHGIVKNHGGAIRVESKQDKGTRFIILFPRTDKQRPKEPNGTNEIAGGTERVLFVDDEQAMVRMWGKLLGPLGYRVICKTNSIEALDLFRSRPDEFDLVITDQTMPHMTGIELSRQILSIRPEIPIILCTGFSEAGTAQVAKAIGVREFLTKPLVLRSLTQAIRRAVNRIR